MAAGGFSLLRGKWKPVVYLLKCVCVYFAAVASVLQSRAQIFQTLATFDGTNGAAPINLTLGNDGNFYGTTDEGGAGEQGNIFKVTPDGQLDILYSFPADYYSSIGPCSSLVLGNDGNFYSTALYDTTMNGSVFRVSTNGDYTTLYSFTGASDQEHPNAMIFGNDGCLYGTANGADLFPGGHDGTVFRVTTNGILTTLATFNITNGASPSAPLTLGPDGNLYGSTIYGGKTNETFPNGMGTIFKVTTNGELTTLVFFDGENGTFGNNALVLGPDGNFYGAAGSGGQTNLNNGHGYGTIFKMTTNGSLTTLFKFNGANGYGPGALTLGKDGAFYGATGNGGDTNLNSGAGFGTVFKITTNGVLTTLHVFNAVDGYYPGSLVCGNDGNLYGITTAGGAYEYDHGTIFRIVTALQPPPTLSVQVSGSNLLLSWPTNTLVAYQLTHSASPAGTNWTIITSVPILTNGQYMTVVPISSSADYFRLQGVN